MAEMTPVARKPILRSEHLYLRPEEREDMKASIAWFSEAEFAEGLNVRAPLGVAAQEQWFEKMREQQGRSAWHFSVCLREDGRPIGFAALISVDHVNGSSELMLGIGDHTCRDKGYSTETVRILLDFAFGELALHRVFLRVFAYNERARHVYERVGFIHEATRREDCYRHGRYYDTLILGILHAEWETQDRRRTWELD